MTNDDGRKPEGAPERSPKAGVGGSGVDGNGPKRFSVQRKMAIVARLLRGEPLELVARETTVSIARLSEWRERALAGAASHHPWIASSSRRPKTCTLPDTQAAHALARCVQARGNQNNNRRASAMPRPW